MILPIVLGIGAALYIANVFRGAKEQIDIQSDGFPLVFEVSFSKITIIQRIRITNVSALSVSLTKVFTSLSYKKQVFAYNPATIPEINIPARLSSVIDLKYTISILDLATVASSMIAAKDYKVTLKAVYNLAGVANTTELEIDFSSFINNIKSKLGL